MHKNPVPFVLWIVLTLQIPPLAPETLGQTLESDLVINGLEGPAQLSAIGDVVAGNGYLFVIDSRARTVERFSLEGDYLGPLGRSGDGPGEFRSPARLGWMADSLWIFDRQQGRVSLFSIEGDFLDSYVSVFDPDQFPFIPTGPYAVLPGREMVVRPEFPENAIDRAPDSVSIVVTHSDGRGPSPLATVSIRSSISRVPIDFRGEPRMIILREPFSDDPLWAVSSTGALVAVISRDADEVEAQLGLHLIRPQTRDTVASVSTPRTARPMTGAIMGSRLDSVIEGFQMDFTENEKARLRRDLSEYIFRPTFVPLAISAFVDADERTWIELSGTESDRSHWLVFDSRGTHLSDVFIPPQIQLIEAAEGFAWGTSTSHFGVPNLHRFRLPPILKGESTPALESPRICCSAYSNGSLSLNQPAPSYSGTTAGNKTGPQSLEAGEGLHEGEQRCRRGEVAFGVSRPGDRPKATSFGGRA